MSEIINTINVLCQQKNQNLPEIDCCLNDLLNNDFNTTFRFVQFFNGKNHDETKKPYFVSGVPGSFYSRLFLRNSLHFIHSSYGLRWLSKGLVSKSKMESFNMPFYDPSAKELKEIVRNEGSFEVKDLEILEYDLGHCNQDETKRSISGKYEANYIRAVSEPLLVAHFGDAIINILFDKFAHHVSQHASCRNKTTVSLVVSLTRK